MNNTYRELSQELLRRIINKGNDLITRDSALNNFSFPIRENYIYPNSSSKPSDINHVVIESSIDSLEGYKYIGNKAGYIKASIEFSNTKYIHEDSQSLIHTQSPIGNELVILNEFVKTTGQVHTYKYIRAQISNYLTPLITWGVENETQRILNMYPLEMYLFPSNVLDWDVVWTLGVTNTTHPFLPNFLFTGLVICVGPYKNIMYEYTDMEGLYGNKYAVYISPLKPVELDYPLGFPREGMLEKDICYKNLIGEYPKEGFIDKDLGTYTGLVTTPEYHSIYKFYMYMRSNYSLFLSSRPPYRGMKDYVLGKREELGLVRDPFIISVPILPTTNIVNDGITKEYIYEYLLHEL